MSEVWQRCHSTGESGGSDAAEGNKCKRQLATSSIIRDHKAQAGVRARSGRPHARAAPRPRWSKGTCDGCRGRLTRIWKGVDCRARAREGGREGTLGKRMGVTRGPSTSPSGDEGAGERAASEQGRY